MTGLKSRYLSDGPALLVVEVVLVLDGDRLTLLDDSESDGDGQFVEDGDIQVIRGIGQGLCFLAGPQRPHDAEVNVGESVRLVSGVAAEEQDRFDVAADG